MPTRGSKFLIVGLLVKKLGSDTEAVEGGVGSDPRRFAVSVVLVTIS